MHNTVECPLCCVVPSIFNQSHHACRVWSLCSQHSPYTVVCDVTTLWFRKHARWKHHMASYAHTHTHTHTHTHATTHTYTHTHTHLYTLAHARKPLWMFLCVCVCVCV